MRINRERNLNIRERIGTGSMQSKISEAILKCCGHIQRGEKDRVAQQLWTSMAEVHDQENVAVRD